ncbi:MAG: HEAT repeat domain-containing protein [Planctomycetes bacterium]|nr:HEAT repeat domain-containing protein [Planctomycetota bacterium]
MISIAAGLLALGAWILTVDVTATRRFSESGPSETPTDHADHEPSPASRVPEDGRRGDALRTIGLTAPADQAGFIEARDSKIVPSGQEPVWVATTRQPYPRTQRTSLAPGKSAHECVGDLLRLISRSETNDPPGGPYHELAALQDELAEMALGRTDALEALIQSASTNADPNVRNTAIVILGRLTTDSAREGLIDIAKNTADPAVRSLAVRSLAQDGGLNVGYNVAGQSRLFNAAQPTPQLGPITNARTLLELASLSKYDADPSVRRTAIRVLSQSQGDGTYPNMNSNGTPVEAVAEFQQVTNRLIEASSGDSDQGVRAEALESLGWSTSPHVAGLLLEIAKDASRSLDERSSALHMVEINERSWENPALDQTLRVLLVDAGSYSTIRFRAAQLFAYLPTSPARVDFLLEIVRRDGDQTVRSAALKSALGLTNENVRRVQILSDILVSSPPGDRQALIGNRLWRDGLLREDMPGYEEAVRQMLELRRRFPEPR